MKLNKILFSVFTLSIFLTNTCMGIDENKQNQAPRQEIVQNRVEITERLFRPNPDSSNILDAIKRPQENKPSNEINEQNSEQKVEKPKPKKSVKKKETTEKKVEPVQTQEQEQQNNPAENSEPNAPQEDKPLPEVSNEEVEKFKNRIPTSSQKEGKEYIIRGLVSMMLVIAGAILLVVVIITSVGNKKRKYGRKKDKNYFDDKF